MARMYGGKRRYLRRMARRYTALALVSCGFVAVLAAVCLIAILAHDLPPALLAAPVLLAAVPGYFFRRRRGYRYGIRGEEAVARALAALDDRHRVFSSLVLPGARGDIDHVVVGPGGVWVLETKNYAGDIACTGDRWARRRNGEWKAMERSPGRQAIDNARRLASFLEGCAVAVPVEPVVVLANSNARIRCKDPAVPVVMRGELASSLSVRKPRLNAKDIRLIAEFIRKSARLA